MAVREMYHDITIIIIQTGIEPNYVNLPDRY